jgi:hypothetical protein
MFTNIIIVGCIRSSSSVGVPSVLT